HRHLLHAVRGAGDLRAGGAHARGAGHGACRGARRRAGERVMHFGLASARDSVRLTVAARGRSTPGARAHSAAALIERGRKIALALPDASEKLSHGEPAFFRGRMFVTVDNDHHGSGHVAIWCRAESGVQQAFVEAEPRHFFVPPYLGSQGWIGVRLDSGLAWEVVQRFVEQAWREAAPTRPAGRSRRPPATWRIASPAG